MIIAFSGPSGSGKSTLIKIVRESPYFGDKKVVLREEDQFVLLQLLRKLIGNKSFSVYKYSKFYEGDKPQSLNSRAFSFLASLFYPAVVYLEFLFEYLYYEVLFRSKILLRDRYIYDYSVTLDKVLKIHNGLSRYLFEKFPKPYLLFFLKIELSTSLIRNKNKIEGKITSNPRFHKEVLLAYSRIAKSKDLLTVDTNGEIRKSFQEVMRYIITKERLLKVRMISLSGLDGSGKTTVANLLCEYSHKLGMGCKVVNIYYGSFIHKLAGKIKKSGSITQRKQGSFLKALITFFISYVQYILIVATHGRELVILDRFFYDYLVNFELLGIGRLGFFKKLMPRVDKSLLLYVDPRIAYQRKKENNYSYYSRSAKLFTKLSKEYDIKAIDVSSKDTGSIMSELIQLI